MGRNWALVLCIVLFGSMSSLIFATPFSDQLFAAAYKSDNQEIKNILDCCSWTEVLHEDSQSNTLLHVAVARNNVELVKILRKYYTSNSSLNRQWDIELMRKDSIGLLLIHRAIWLVLQEDSVDFKMIDQLLDFVESPDSFFKILEICNKQNENVFNIIAGKAGDIDLFDSVFWDNDKLTSRGELFLHIRKKMVVRQEALVKRQDEHKQSQLEFRNRLQALKRLKS